MRRISAVLALIVSLFGLPLGFMGGFEWASVFTFGLFWLALIVGAISALRGSDLIYLATAWGIFIGMNLVSSIDIVGQAGSRPEDLFSVTSLVGVLAFGLIGLSLALIANAKERNR
jgi:hypothetical protein